MQWKNRKIWKFQTNSLQTSDWFVHSSFFTFQRHSVHETAHYAIIKIHSTFPNDIISSLQWKMYYSESVSVWMLQFAAILMLNLLFGTVYSNLSDFCANYMHKSWEADMIIFARSESLKLIWHLARFFKISSICSILFFSLSSENLEILLAFFSQYYHLIFRISRFTLSHIFDTLISLWFFL